MSPLTTRHPDLELLSAYLDDEVGLVAARALESHLQTCDACRGQLRQLRGVVHQLSGLERPAPPPWLITQVRREVLYKEKESFWMRLGGGFLQLPLATPVASALSVLLSAGFVLLLFSSIGGSLANTLATYPGPVEPPKSDPNFIVTETTSEVAGRTFVRQEDGDLWNYLLYEAAGQTESAGRERTVWVEQGLTADPAPRESIDARSPEGRALLARYSDLGYLLADGSRVVMRYQRATLELRSGA
ncbi:MAG TPA: zf-HC2 domain-containing protein [Thermoanaerobaculia bacterium]|nr:zf-HC2 domain-containing protein [Thermoanaerobaculia bacterium]